MYPTGIIKKEAEMVGYKAKVDTICYTEAIILADPLDFLRNCFPKQWRSLRCLNTVLTTRFGSMLMRFINTVA